MGTQEHGLIIGGRQQAAASGESFAVLAPEDGRLLASVSRAGEADVELAVAAARQGFDQWSALAMGVRGVPISSRRAAEAPRSHAARSGRFCLAATRARPSRQDAVS